MQAWTERLRVEGSIHSGENRRILLLHAEQLESAIGRFIRARTLQIANEALKDLNTAWAKSITEQARIAGGRPQVKVAK